MSITTLSSGEFDRDTSRAKKAAMNGPVFVTDRGKPSHVLLTIEEYRRLAGTGQSLVAPLAMPDAEAVEFAPPTLGGPLFRPADIGTCSHAGACQTEHGT
jgi:prevent-host-death family protein